MCTAKLVVCFPWYAAVGVLPCEIHSFLPATLLEPTGWRRLFWQVLWSESGRIARADQAPCCKRHFREDWILPRNWWWLHLSTVGDSEGILGAVFEDLPTEKGGPRFVFSSHLCGHCDSCPGKLVESSEAELDGMSNVSPSFFPSTSQSEICCVIRIDSSRISSLW